MEFAPLDPETAPTASKPLVAGSQKQFGFVPSPVAKLARSPQLLKQLFAGFAAFEHASLSPLEQEVVAMTVAFENECHYCMALHSARVADDGLRAALRAGTALPDPKLEALRGFVRALLAGRGRVSPSAWAAFEAAGYGEAAALDALLGVGVYVLSTLGNVMTEAELDAPFVPFRWTKP